MGGGGGAGGDDNRKQNHCEIEKRRRDKMNHYITELASVIPAFSSSQSKLDKLTVLRMAVQHVKSLRSSLCSFSSFHLRPSFLSSGNLLKNLILQMASQEAQDNLFMVVTCDRGKVLFVSESSSNILNQDQHEMVGQSLFDILHKDDVSKVKEQISYINLMPKEMLVDSKTLQPIKSNQRESFFQLQNQSANSTLQPGSRRSFFCRMKCGRIWPPPEKTMPAEISTKPVSHSRACNTLKASSTNLARNTLANQPEGASSDGSQQNAATTATGDPDTALCATGESMRLKGDKAAETLIGSKNREATKQQSSGRHGKSGSMQGKRNERLSHHHQRSHRKDSNKLAATLGDSEASKYLRGPAVSSGSKASSFSSSSSSARTNSSESGISSTATGSRKPSLKSTRTNHHTSTITLQTPKGHSAPATTATASTTKPKTTTTTTTASKCTGEMSMSQEMDSLNGRRQSDGVVEFSARKMSEKLAEADETEQNASEERRLNSQVVCDVSDKRTETGEISSINGVSCSLGRQASQGTLAGAQRSTSANESSPSSTSSASSSADSSLFASNTTKKADKDLGARCKQRRTGGLRGALPTSGGSMSSSALSNSIGAISFNRKQWRYIVMHCTGYLKSITVRNDEFDDEDENEDDGENEGAFDERAMSLAKGGNGGAQDNTIQPDEPTSDIRHHDNQFRTVNCLVAVCRRSVMDRYLKPDRPLTFTCRYSMEGKFTFVDQRTTVALGYMPQQLVGTSHYAYCHEDSVNTFKECHRQCILNSETVSSDIYQFRRANGQHLWLQTSLKSFRNPWTKLIDYIVANHTTAEGSDPRYNEGCVPTKFNQDMTGGASQSSSPASSTSISCLDSKKSTSPSSSSIGSSYSLDSYASGANIQALLNKIDRVKSGSCQHPFKSSKKRGDSHHHHHHALGSTGSSSARKSNDDSGNYSDLQSCSSISSQNSGASSTGGYLNMQSASAFEATNPTQTSQATQTTGGRQQEEPRRQQQQQSEQISRPAGQQQLSVAQAGSASSLRAAYNTFNRGQKILNTFGDDREGRGEVEYQPLRGPSQPSADSQQTRAQQDFTNEVSALVRSPDQVQYATTANCKNMIGPRMVTARLNRPPINTTSAIKPLQRPCVYSYRGPLVKNQTTVTGLGGQRVWTTNPGYNPGLAHSQSGRRLDDLNKNSMEQRSTNVCHLQSGKSVPRTSYQLEQRQPQPQHQLVPLNVMQTQLDSQLQNQGREANYDQQLGEHMAYSATGLIQPMDHYLATSSVEPHYASDAMDHQLSLQQVSRGELRDELVSMTLSQRQQTSQQEPPSDRTNRQQNNMDIGIPMIWNSETGNSDGVRSGENNGAYHNAMQDGAQHSMQPTSNSSNQSNRSEPICMDVAVADANNQLGMQQQTLVGQQCQQCANHKCCFAQNQQMAMMNSNGDLNSMHLSSLAVDDLDEGELLECLAACDPNAQLYNLQQNVTYPTQYNIYRE